MGDVTVTKSDNPESELMRGTAGPASQAGRGLGTPGQRTGGSSPWRLRNWRLRTKLLVVMLIPTLAALFLGGLRFYSDVSTADHLENLASLAKLQSRSSELIHQLQKERDSATRFVAADRPSASSSGEVVPGGPAFDRQRVRVDKAERDFRTDVDMLTPDLPAETAQAFRATARELSRIPELRKATVSGKYPEDALLDAYSNLIASLLNLNQLSAATGGDDSSLARTQLATASISRMQEQLSVRRALVYVALERKSLPASQAIKLVAAEAVTNAARDDFRNAATPEQRRFFEDTFTQAQVDIANGIEAAAIQKGLQGQVPSETATRWDSVVSNRTVLIHTVEQSLLDSLTQRSDQLAVDARNSAMIEAAIVLATLIIGLIIMLVVAASLLRPLRTLRETAMDVANRRLPEAVEGILAAPDPVQASKTAIAPVPVHSSEEVGEVARAFDAVHGEAVRLATGQALLKENMNAMFINLSRRSQALVERQLALIDRLERDEQDPDQLSSLFELDHLATRMRRNSENLLVLSGTELSRRLGKPIAITEVLGAAKSEIEQYVRVQILNVPEVPLAGRAANDLIHLVAELLDNATTFSDPQTPVNVHTGRNRDGDLAIEIVDNGFGIPEDELEQINERLADPPSVDVSVARRMGLYVVARLAKRHDILVRLRNNEGDVPGLTALVVVPSTLLSPGVPDARTSSGMSHPGMPVPAEIGGGNPPFQVLRGRGENTVTEVPTMVGGPPVVDEAPSGSRGSTPSMFEPVDHSAYEPTDQEVTASLFQPITIDDEQYQDRRSEDDQRFQMESPADDPADQSADDRAVDAPHGAHAIERVDGAAGHLPSPRTPHGARSAEMIDAEPETRVSLFTAEPEDEPSGAHAADARESDTNPGGEAVVPSPEPAEPFHIDTPRADAPAVDDRVPGTLGAPTNEQAPEPRLTPAPRRADDAVPASEPVPDHEWLFNDAQPDDVEVPVVDQFAPRPIPGLSGPVETGVDTTGGGGVSSVNGTTPRRDFREAPTERLPIYEAMLSQWFKSMDTEEPPVPLDDELDQTVTLDAIRADGPPGIETPRWRTPEQAATEIPAEAEPVDPTAGGGFPSEAVRPVPPSARPRPEPTEDEVIPSAPEVPEPATAVPTPAPRSAPVGAVAPNPARSWVSAGDDGWKAAEALVAAPSQLTPAGLPKRVPKAHLVPGSAASRPAEAPPLPAGFGETRTASSIRGRMSQFQSGLKRGRHAKVDPAIDETNGAPEAGPASTNGATPRGSSAGHSSEERE